MAHAAEPTSTHAPTRLSADAAAPATGAAIAALTAALAVSPNSESARVAPTPSPPTVPVDPMARLARDSARANVVAPRGTVETMTASAVLAASLCLEPVNPRRRTSRPTAPAAQTARHAWVSVKEAAAALRGTAELAATFVALAVSRDSEPVMTAPKMSRQTANAAKMAKPARASPRVNVAVLPGTVGLGTIFATPAASQVSGLATATPGASRQTASAARMAKRAKVMPRVSVAALPASAGLGMISAVPVARRPLGLATAAREASRQMVNVARMVRLARDLPRVSVVPPLDIAGKTLPSAARAASLRLALATAAPEA